MGDVVDLRSRRVYSFRQIDDVLKLHPGTSSRWIDGYERGGKSYQPVVRPARTGDDVATWGEFVECRLLSEYRNAGVSLHRMRPAVERLREVTNSDYPLASAQLWVAAEGRDLVAQVQEDVGLDQALNLVVLRTGQSMFDWSTRAKRFSQSIRWSSTRADAQPILVIPDARVPVVEVDPDRGYGDPVLNGRNLTTSVVQELFDAGESVSRIADNYELTTDEVESAIRFERLRSQRSA